MPDKPKNNGPVSLSLIGGNAAQGCRRDIIPTGGAGPYGMMSPQYCEECGGRLIRIGYCFTCMNCGWGACS